MNAGVLLMPAHRLATRALCYVVVAASKCLHLNQGRGLGETKGAETIWVQAARGELYVARVRAAQIAGA